MLYSCDLNLMNQQGIYKLTKVCYTGEYDESQE